MEEEERASSSGLSRAERWMKRGFTGSAEMTSEHI